MTTMVKVVLITGCSKGIGEGIAIHLAKDSQQRYKVYATMRNLKTGASDITAKAGKLVDVTLFLLEMDVTKQETIDRTVKEIIDKEGTIDVLVNNAGVTDANWWATDSMDNHYRIMNTNHFGYVRMIQAVVPFMVKKRQGKVIQISSILGFRAAPLTSAAYIASKFAIEGYTEAIAPPLRKRNVWVSLIQPGPVMTPLMEQLGGDMEQICKALVQTIPGDMREVVEEMVTSNIDEFLLEIESVEALAEKVEHVIDCDKPDFRVQTTEDTKRLSKERFVDPTGNASITQWI